jgi:hypothetical protein
MLAQICPAMASRQRYDETILEITGALAKRIDVFAPNEANTAALFKACAGVVHDDACSCVV